MSLSSANLTLQLISRLIDTETSTEPIVDMGPQKPEIPIGRSSHPLPTATPEQQGIPSRHIAAFLQTLDKDPTLRMHSVLVIRHGQLLCKAAFGAQNPELPRMTFSACKSITALAIGLLMDDGLLHPEDKLTELFPGEAGPLSKRLMKDLTLHHLLTMQTGNLFNEAASMTQTDWVKNYFLSPALDTERKFRYNSLNTYILSALVTRVTGKSLSGFLQERLFAPMGIADYYWEVSPEGVEKGGWGLYMRAEDLGKLGQLILDDGLWEGRRLISSDFLRQATATHAIAPEEYGDYNYGWQIWVGRSENTFLFSGMLGQNVLGFRDSGILLVSHAGNSETFQTSSYYALASRFFGGSFPASLPRNHRGELELKRTLDALSDCSGKLPAASEFRHFSGKRFFTEDPQAASAGLLPLILQAVENSYSRGLRAVSIGGTRAAPELFYEEHDQLHHLVCGVKTPLQQTVCCHGNVFRTAVQARFTHDEEENPVLRIQIDFLETPCTRILKLVCTKGGMILRQEETPGAEFLSNAAGSLTKSPHLKPVLASVLGSAEQGYLRWRMEKMFTQSFRLTQEI